jgi:hypothetical protein
VILRRIAACAARSLANAHVLAGEPVFTSPYALVAEIAASASEHAEFAAHSGRISVRLTCEPLGAAGSISVPRIVAGSRGGEGEPTMQRCSPALFALPVGTLALMLALTPTARAECLVAPRDAAPAGQHWFYRTDQATKQKCWYLRERDVETTGAMHAQQSARSDGTSADQSGAPPSLSKSDQDALFQDFLRWRKQRGEKP